VPGRAQSRSSFQPIAGNHFNEIVGPLLATADSDADDFVLRRQTDGDRYFLAQGCGVGFFPSSWSFGDRSGGDRDRSCDGEHCNVDLLVHLQDRGVLIRADEKARYDDDAVVLGRARATELHMPDEQFSLIVSLSELFPRSASPATDGYRLTLT